MLINCGVNVMKLSKHGKNVLAAVVGLLLLTGVGTFLLWNKDIPKGEGAGEIRQTSVKTAQKGVFKNYVIENSKAYNTIKVGNIEGDYPLEDYVDFYNTKGNSLSVNGVSFKRKNIPGFNLSALVPEGHEFAWSKNSAGWVYLKPNHKNEYLYIGLTFKQSTEKDAEYIQSTMQPAFDQFVAPVHNVGQVGFRLFENQRFSQLQVDKEIQTYVTKGPNNTDYIQSTQALDGSSQQTPKLVRYVEFPRVDFNTVGSTGEKQPLDYEVDPITVNDYTVVRDGIFLTTSFYDNANSRKADTIREIMMNSVGNPIQERNSVSKYDSEEVGSFVFAYPQSNITKTVSFSKTKGNIGDPATNDIAVRAISDVMRKKDASAKKIKSESLDDPSALLSTDLLKEDTFSPTGTRGDWKVSTYKFTYLGGNPYSKGNNWLLYGNLSGLVTVLHNTKDGETVIVAVRENSFEDTLSVMNDILARARFK